MKAKVAFKVSFLLAAIFIFNGAVLADYPSTVLTPNGSTVNTTTVTTELDAWQISLYIAWTQTNFPNAVILANPTKKYNCHSYAWYWQSTGNTKWMNTPGDDTYWLDGSYWNTYYPIASDKVSYASDDHSGIFDGNNYVISKWGNKCLVRHLSSYCPYNPLILRYYRR
ncbi:MAG: hypothetical protein WC415_05260 [Patescibacteria group bacterium]|jgi:hypothetical protein